MRRTSPGTYGGRGGQGEGLMGSRSNPPPWYAIPHVFPFLCEAVLSTERSKYVASSKPLRGSRYAVMPPAKLAGQLLCAALRKH